MIANIDSSLYSSKTVIHAHLHENKLNWTQLRLTHTSADAQVIFSLSHAYKTWVRAVFCLLCWLPQESLLFSAELLEQMSIHELMFAPAEW